MAFETTGPVAQYQSLSSFRVNGQLVNASGSEVKFVNGAATGLRNGVRVHVTGSKVVDGVLIANAVEFL